MSYKEVQMEILPFIYAGFDTTGITTSAVLLCLAMNQDVQDKVVEEINRTFLTEDDEVDVESLSKMVYLEMVVKEAMRFFPVNTFSGRYAKDDVKLCKFRVYSCLTNLMKINMVN